MPRGLNTARAEATGCHSISHSGIVACFSGIGATLRKSLRRASCLGSSKLVNPIKDCPAPKLRRTSTKFQDENIPLMNARLWDQESDLAASMVRRPYCPARPKDSPNHSAPTPVKNHWTPSAYDCKRSRDRSAHHVRL